MAGAQLGRDLGEGGAASGHGVATVGIIGDFAQQLGLEPAQHDLALAIKHVRAGRIRAGHIAAIFGANAYGKDIDAGFFCLGDDRVEGTLVFFAVAQEDERIIFLAGLLEGGDGQADRGAEVRASEGHPVFIDLLDGFAHRSVVDRQRGEQMGTAGEAHQSDALVRQGVQQFVDNHLGLG